MAQKINQTQMLGGDYSTSEVNTGAKWIDGKDIYKKTVSYGALPNSTTKTVAHGVSNMETLIDYDAFAYNGPVHLSIPFTDTNTPGNQVQLVVNTSATSTINITTGSNRSSYSAYVTLYYTKA